MPPQKCTCGSTIVAVQEVVDELKKKHGSKYSSERLNAWAHVVNLGKHGSLDEPPDLPFLEREKQVLEKPHLKHRTQWFPQQVPKVQAKRFGVRTECIDQLSKWHGLLTKGAISQSQYEELKQTILKDMAVESAEI